MSEPAAKYETGAEQPAPLPCPFCGSTNLGDMTTYMDWGELGEAGLLDKADATSGVDGWECLDCRGGAPHHAWNTRHIEGTPEWHYPQSNLDMENMPEPGQTVVVFYYDGDRIRGPIVATPVAENGTHLDAKGNSTWCPIVRWHAIPEE